MKKGFTLIEMLVVVLIIGILSAVALPQYNKAVEKSRQTEAIMTVNTLMRAIQSYVMTYRRCPTALNDLDVRVEEESKKFRYGVLSANSGRVCYAYAEARDYEVQLHYYIDRSDAKYATTEWQCGAGNCSDFFKNNGIQ